MLTHFIAMTKAEAINAERVFGAPDFIHHRWDVRAKQEIAPGDRAIFGGGKTIADEPTIHSFNDSAVN